MCRSLYAMDAITLAISSLHEKLLLHEDMHSSITRGICHYIRNCFPVRAAVFGPVHLQEHLQTHLLPVLGQSVPPIPGAAEPHAGQEAHCRAVTHLQ